MQRLTSLNNLKSHFSECQNNITQRIKMPEASVIHEKPVLTFKDYQYSLKVGFTVYADIESILRPVKTGKNNNTTGITVSSEKQSSSTTVLTEHIAAAYGFICIDSLGKVHTEDYYAGVDCMEKFLSKLESLSKEVINIYQTCKKPLVMTAEDENLFKKATRCHICEKDYFPDDHPCRDHCHLTGKFRGSAHVQCNAKYTQRLILPVLIHNFKNYDSNLIIKSFKNIGRNIQIIPTNSSKFLAVKCDKVLFLDSCQFMLESLSQLAVAISDKDSNFQLLYDKFGKQAKFLKRKGIFPYDFLDSFEKLKCTTFPSQTDFFNKLTNESVSDNDYSYAKLIYKKFNCKTLLDYTLLYLTTDVLACVFEYFRKLSLNYYKLDPLYFYSCPWSSVCSSVKIY